MKKFIALSAISAKFTALLCVSFIALFGMNNDSFAINMAPCHEKIAQENNAKLPCEMCEMSAESWDKKAIISSDFQFAKVKKLEFITSNFIENLKYRKPKFKIVGKNYLPPPQALLKSVTPKTKKIVLLS